MTSFKALLWLEFLLEFYQAFDLSHCSESKLFHVFIKLTVKTGVPKWLRWRPTRYRCLLGFIFSWPTKRMSIFLQKTSKRRWTNFIFSFNLPYPGTILETVTLLIQFFVTVLASSASCWAIFCGSESSFISLVWQCKTIFFGLCYFLQSLHSNAQKIEF